MRTRQPELTIAVGRKYIGKTYYTKKLVKAYSGQEDCGFKPRRVLIFDINGEFTEYKTIALGDIHRFSHHPLIEVRRVLPIKPDGTKMSLDEMCICLDYILSKFRNGLLLLEDINKYLSDTITKDIIGSIVTQRHINTDIIIHFQTKGKAGHPKLLGNCNTLRIHETTDSFLKHSDKFEEHLEPCMLAEMLVKVRNDKQPPKERWSIAFLRLNPYSISGDFTEEEKRECISNYILQNQNKTIAPMLKIKDRKGNLLYNHETAFFEKEKELYQNYFEIDDDEI